MNAEVDLAKALDSVLSPNVPAPVADSANVTKQSVSTLVDELRDLYEKMAMLVERLNDTQSRLEL